MTAAHPMFRLKLALLFVTCVHLALLITTAVISIFLRRRNLVIFNRWALHGSSGYAGFADGIPVGPTLPAAVLGLVFWLGVAFSVPQVAVCGLLVARRSLPSRCTLISFVFLNVVLLAISGVGAGFYTGLLDVPATFESSSDSDSEVYTGPQVQSDGSSCISSDGVPISAAVCSSATRAGRLAIADFVLAWLTVLVALVMCIVATVLFVRMLRARRAEREEEEQQPAMSNMYAQTPGFYSGGYASVQTSDNLARQNFAFNGGYPSAQPMMSNAYAQQAPTPNGGYVSSQPAVGSAYPQQASTPDAGLAPAQPIMANAHAQQASTSSSGDASMQQQAGSSGYTQQEQASGSGYPHQQQASGSANKGKQARRSMDFQQQQQASGSSYRQQDASGSGSAYPQQHAGGSTSADV